MILGKVAGIYAAVISKPALDLLTEHNMYVKYDTIVPNIINRTHTGVCPVEQLCLPLSSLSDMYNAISHFVHK
jgi:iron complex outermembrane receptor protein